VFEKLIKRISLALKKHNIPYMIIGGQAVAVYGEPRFTRDIDITLGVDIDNIQKVKEISKTLNLSINVKEPDFFIKRTRVMPLIHRKSGIRVDFIFSFSSYEKIAIKRNRKIKIGSAFANCISPEDLIIHKIIAGRARDIEDAISVIIKRKRLNIKYIKKWLAVFDKSLASNYFVRFNNIYKQYINVR